MKFNIGDKVRVRAFEDLIEEFDIIRRMEKTFSCSYFDTPYRFIIDTMKDYCGQTFTIRESDALYKNDNFYWGYYVEELQATDSDYIFDECVLEAIEKTVERKTLTLEEINDNLKKIYEKHYDDEYGYMPEYVLYDNDNNLTTDLVIFFEENNITYTIEDESAFDSPGYGCSVLSVAYLVDGKIELEQILCESL